MRDGDWPDPAPINPPYDGFGDYDDPTRADFDRDTSALYDPNNGLIEALERLQESRKAEEARRKETAKWEGIQARFGKGEETFLDRMEIYQLLQQKAESQ